MNKFELAQFIAELLSEYGELKGIHVTTDPQDIVMVNDVPDIDLYVFDGFKKKKFTVTVEGY